MRFLALLLIGCSAPVSLQCPWVPKETLQCECCWAVPDHETALGDECPSEGPKLVQGSTTMWTRPWSLGETRVDTYECGP